MRILITGGAGFIGSNLALALQADHEVTVIDDFSSGHFENLRGFRGDVVVTDVASVDLLSKCDKFDVIYHQASITDTTITDQRKMIGTNVEGFRNILDFATKQNAKVIYASSAAVYGNARTPMKETQEPSPLNSYAFSKCIMDNLALRYKEKHPEMTIIGLRYFNVFGPREQAKGKSCSMVYQLAQQMLQNKRPRLFKYGEQKRDHIYVKDIIAANMKALEVAESGIVNIGTGVATSFNKIVEILNKVLGKSYEPEYFDNPFSFYQNETQADLSEARKLLGFEPQYGIEEGIRDYLSHMDAY